MTDYSQKYQMTPVVGWLLKDRGGMVLLTILIAAAILVPIGNLLVPETSSFHVPTWMLSLLGKYLCYALLALSVDLIWGFCGILSLGHGAFFALGGYAMGMYLMRQIGDRGVYGNPELPDFMVFLNWTELPWYWYGFDMFWFAIVMAMFVPGLLAFVFGFLAFRSRVTGVYLSIITQAMTYALLLAFFRNDMGFGGNNGLTDFKDLLGYSLQSDGTRAGLFVASCVFLGICYILARGITQSRLGKVLIAIRDAESRVRFTGYRVEYYTLYGAVLGAFIVNYAKTFFTGVMPDFWLFFLGGLFIAVTLLLPKGVIGAVPAFGAPDRQSILSSMRKRLSAGGKA